MGTEDRKMLEELDRFAEACRELRDDLKLLIESGSDEWRESDDGEYALLAVKKLDLAADFLSRPV